MNLSLAQSNSNSSSDGSQSSHNHATLFGFPFPFDFSQFPFFGGQREAEATAPAEVSAAEENTENGDNQNRFFFHLFSPSTYVSCNSSTQVSVILNSIETLPARMTEWNDYISVWCRISSSLLRLRLFYLK